MLSTGDLGGNNVNTVMQQDVLSNVVCHRHLNEYDTVSYITHAEWKQHHDNIVPLDSGDNELDVPRSTPAVLQHALEPGFALGFHRRHFPCCALTHLGTAARPILDDDLIFPVFSVSLLTDEDKENKEKGPKMVAGKGRGVYNNGSRGLRMPSAISARGRYTGAIMVRNLLQLHAQLHRQQDFYGRAAVFTVEVSELAFRLVCHWVLRRGGGSSSKDYEEGSELDGEDVYNSRVLRCWAIADLNSYEVYSDLVQTVRNCLDWSLVKTFASVLDDVKEVDCLLRFYNPAFCSCGSLTSK